MKEFVTLQLREKDYVFRALDLDQLEELEPQFIAAASISGATMTSMPKEAMQAVAAIAAASLQYKHPGITLAECRKLITLATMGTVMEAIRGVSGVVPSGEA